MPTQTGEQKGILVQVKEKSQLTLPQKIRKVLGIQKGDYLEAMVKNNTITLTPKMIVNKMPTVTLSEKGEKMLEEALEDERAGRVKKFNNIQDLIKDLDN